MRTWQQITSELSAPLRAKGYTGYDDTVFVSPAELGSLYRWISVHGTGTEITGFVGLGLGALNEFASAAMKAAINPIAARSVLGPPGPPFVMTSCGTVADPLLRVSADPNESEIAMAATRLDEGARLLEEGLETLDDLIILAERYPPPGQVGEFLYPAALRLSGHNERADDWLSSRESAPRMSVDSATYAAYNATLRQLNVNRLREF